MHGDFFWFITSVFVSNVGAAADIYDYMGLFDGDYVNDYFGSIT